MPWIYLVLVVVVLIVGLGVVVVNRRRTAAPTAAPTPPRVPRPEFHRRPAAGRVALRPHRPRTSQPSSGRTSRAPNFRSRMSKARNALAGTLLGIRSRSGITNETWDDLEEALLRADVGVRVTDDLLGGLRTKVKAKEITEPTQLLDALQAEMVDRLSTRRPNACTSTMCPAARTCGCSSASTASARPRRSARSALSRRRSAERC